MTEFATPGKQVAASSATATGPAAKTPVPGKATRLGPDRARLEGMVSSAVGRAHTAYEIALASLELERRLEKDDELGPIAGVLFLAGGKALEIAFSIVVRELRAAGAVMRSLEEAGVHVAAKEAEGISHELTEKGIEGAIGISVDVGKEKAKAPIAKAVGGDEKDVALQYIERLKDGAMFLFESLANQVYGLDDASLVAAKETLRAENILPSKFQHHLGEKLESFLKTKIRDVGKREGSKSFVLEHKVGWVYGQGERYLAYVDDAIDHVPAASPGPAYEDGAQLSLADEGTWSRTQDNMPMGQQHESGLAQAHLAHVEFKGRVEDEFADAAVEQHQAKWLAAPRNYTIHGVSQGRPHLEIL